MSWFPLVVLAWCAWSCWRLSGRVAKLAEEVRELRYQAGRAKREVEESSSSQQTLRSHVAALAAGQKVSRDQILKGQFYTEITALEAYERLRADPAAPLVDVRSPEEFLADHAAGAKLIPLDELPHRLAELEPKDRPLMLICASGGRSQQAAEWLATQGWTDVASVRGGTGSWPGPREARTMMQLKYAPPPRPA